MSYVMPEHQAAELAAWRVDDAEAANGSAAPSVCPSAHCQRPGYWHRGAAALMLVPALPLIGVLVIVIRLTSRGPGLYRQRRVGLHGRTFYMCKLRTMRHDAEVGTGAVWAAHRDPRVTPIGRFLRATHLDELPQLFNVLVGHMNLIGPRPERPEIVPTLAEEIPGYAQRLMVRPGVTGLAQINLPPDVNLDCVRRKLRLDLEYIETANSWLDLRILLCTGLRIFGLKGHVTCGLLGLKRRPELDAEGARPSISSLPSANSIGRARPK